MVDYPVLESEAAMALLRQWVAEDACDVGAQLHPWVNPPHEEDVTTANSYVGTLPEALERAKIVALRDRIAQETGKPPRSEEHTSALQSLMRISYAVFCLKKKN